MKLMSKDIGIDLGTSTTLVYVKGSGVVLNEPTVVAINDVTGEVLAVGATAKEMLGRTPDNIVAVKPLRGGVIDVFSVNNEDPVRIEFFGDEIDSIRYFDLDSQRTIKQIKDVRIISATDLIINDEIYDNNLTKIESSFLVP